MPTHNSHTHCQVAQANAQSKTWQRVCLFQRTTDRQSDDRKEGRTANIGFAKWRVQCFYDSLVQGSSSVFQLSICAENPPLRKAENRCKQL